MELELGQEYKVRVVKYLKKGIIVRFVDKPAETAFIHISEISPDYVKDVSTFVRLGDELVARCVFDPKHENQLSLKHLCLHKSYEPAGLMGQKINTDFTNASDTKNTIGYRGMMWDQHVIQPEMVAIHVDYAQSEDKSVISSAKAKSDDSLDKMLKEANASLADKMKSNKSKPRNNKGRKS